MAIINLGYHFVRDYEAPGLNTTPDRLCETVERLRSSGYTFLSCREAFWRHCAGKLPGKVATLSFDDGLRDQYTTAFPILRGMGIPATFFIITCTLEGKFPPVIGLQYLIDHFGAENLELEILPDVLRGTPYATLLDPDVYDIGDAKKGEPKKMRRIKWVWNHFMSAGFKADLMDEIFRYIGEGVQESGVREWFIGAAELQEMNFAGMEIAAHSINHHPFDISGLDEIGREACESRERLEQLKVGNITTFGWPFGGVFSSAAQERIAKYYTSAWNFSHGGYIPENPFKNPMDIPRLNEATAKLL